MKIKVCSLTKKSIQHLYIKKINKHNFVTFGIMLLMVMLSVLGIKYIDVFNGYDQLCTEIYNPIDALFNDNGGIVFTSKMLNNINKNNLKFVTPIKCSDISIVDDTINYVIDNSIMIIAPEDGIIKSIGYLPNGEKYIEIAHSKNIVSRLENIYITGVVTGQVVAKGKDIATARMDSVVRFSIYEDGIKISNLKLNKNVITWEN
ncbi:MAG: M23 family metallopeptidase [Firmicutes bacterium]|nr:M23 family metallopeptidase [Bacillota bacterium]